MTKESSSAVLSHKPLPTAGPYPTADPLLFCVYHKDEYPAGNEQMETSTGIIGNGSDFNPTASFRMYHGRTIPGFPQHPHRGFETITATMEGIIDHADSLGNGGRYGQGDVQWMTAGQGIVHSEMFPLLNQQSNNPTRFFQLWLNLPAANKMVPPAFAMFWASTIPQFTSTDGRAQVTLWVGNDYLGLGDKNPNQPPKDSWAANIDNDVVMAHITVQPGGSITLPPAHVSTVHRSLYYIEGPTTTTTTTTSSTGTSKSTVDGIPIQPKISIDLDPTREVTLTVPSNANVPGEWLWLQGRPIQEPKAQYGPFVMNSQEEIIQAFQDYEETEFGGWPWPRDDMVFPRNKERFALFNGVETTPPDADNNIQNVDDIGNKYKKDDL